MPEVEKEVVVEPQKEEKEEPKSDLDNLDVKELVSIIKNTRGEAAANRIAAKELKDKLDAIEAQKAKEAEEKLLKNGEYETLIKTKDSLITEYEKKAKAYDEYVTAIVEGVKKDLGEDWDDSFASLPLASIQKLAKTVIKPPVEKIEVDNPQHGKKIELQNVTLTKSEEDEAIRRYPNVEKARAFELYKGNKLKKLERLKEKGK